MKSPKNFYNAVDQKKLGIDDLFTRTAENEADIAAIEEVIENLPEITPVEANPDEPITGILNSVKIGDTNYRVRDEAKITSIKKLNILLTGSNDGYNIALGKVVIYNSITSESYTFINGTDTIACDKPYHDSDINNCLYGYAGSDCRVYKNQGAPTFTITFGNELNIERYDTLAIYSTNPVSMSANNVKVAISPDGESFVDTIDKNMTWPDSTATPNEIGKIYEITDPVIDAIITQIETIEDDVNDIETGINGHLLADVTSADEGKIMSVDSNGDWVSQNIPTQCATFIATYAWQAGTWTLTPEQCAEIIRLYPSVPVFIKGSNNTMTVVDCNSSNIIASKVTCSAGYVYVTGVNIDPTTGIGTEESKTIH